LFYQKFWDIVKGDLMKLFQEFYVGKQDVAQQETAVAKGDTDAEMLGNLGAVEGDGWIQKCTSQSRKDDDDSRSNLSSSAMVCS
jgi:hypothetical protein